VKKVTFRNTKATCLFSYVEYPKIHICTKISVLIYKLRHKNNFVILQLLYGTQGKRKKKKRMVEHQ
jgi:hypothetical protein